MSGLIALVPIIFEAVGSAATAVGAAVGTAAAAVGSAALSAGAAVFGAGAAAGTVGGILSGAVTTGLAGGVLGGAISAISGGNFFDGFKTGAISGALAGGIGASGLLGDLGIGGSAAASSTAGIENVVSTPMNSTFSGMIADSGASGLATAGNVVGDTIGTAASNGAANAAVGGAANAGSAASGAAGAIENVASTPMNPTLSGLNAPGLFDKGGFIQRNGELIGGAISGVGKVLSGDTAQAAAKANNQGAMDRQVQAQDNTAGNYDLSGGLMGGNNTDQGNGRPTPTQQFGQQANNNSGAWEYYFDPTTKTLKRRALNSGS